MLLVMTHMEGVGSVNVLKEPCLGVETYLIGLNPPGGGMSCIGVPPNGVAMRLCYQKVLAAYVSLLSRYMFRRS